MARKTTKGFKFNPKAKTSAKTIQSKTAPAVKANGRKLTSIIKPNRPSEKRPWTDADFEEMVAAVERNGRKRDSKTVEKLAKKLRRTPGAIRQKMHAHGLHLLG